MIDYVITNEGGVLRDQQLTDSNHEGQSNAYTVVFRVRRKGFRAYYYWWGK
jgi:hypothetical protein